MDIFCPACQKKLQLPDTSAGQTVKCPMCAANFQAPSMPAAGPLPRIEPLVPPAEVPTPASPPAEPSLPKGKFARIFTINVRNHIVMQIPPIGIAILFVLSFFPWRHTESAKLNLWELAFTEAGFTAFFYYVLLLIVAALVVLITPLLERNILPAPVGVRPFLPWLPMASAFLNVAAWLLFMIHYFHCTFLDARDPATLGMKLAIRLHTVIVVAAFLDIWLERRKRRDLPEPSIQIRW